MASTSETGHAKNVANFDKLLSSINGYGSKYNPSRKALTLPALQTQHDEADASLAPVKTTKKGFDDATNARRDLFKPAKKYATRIVNAPARRSLPTTSPRQPISRLAKHYKKSISTIPRKPA